MLKKLTQEQLDDILETAIRLFGDRGVERVSVAEIAKQSGVSVGVIYKYYASKQVLFEACMEHSLQKLDDEIEASVNGMEIGASAGRLLQAGFDVCREHPAYIRMYHQITGFGDVELQKKYAVLIESRSAKRYTEIIRRAQASGIVRRDIDASMLAYFMDNLLMMMHFSAGCPYYQERYRVFCGGDSILEDTRVREAFVSFVQSAFGHAEN